MKTAQQWAIALILVVALLVLGSLGTATQAEPGSQEAKEDVSIERRLASMAEQLRMAMTLTTLAVLSPTPAAQRLHIQQVINLLEGTGGRHFVKRVSPQEEIPGLIPCAQALFARLETTPLNPMGREPISVAAKHTLSLLNSALETSLFGLRQRRLERASDEMLKAYAYLTAALGCGSDPTDLSGVLVLSRLFLASSPASDGTREQP